MLNARIPFYVNHFVKACQTAQVDLVGSAARCPPIMSRTPRFYVNSTELSAAVIGNTA